DSPLTAAWISSADRPSRRIASNTVDPGGSSRVRVSRPSAARARPKTYLTLTTTAPAALVASSPPGAPAGGAPRRTPFAPADGLPSRAALSGGRSARPHGDRLDLEEERGSRELHDDDTRVRRIHAVGEELRVLLAAPLGERRPVQVPHEVRR